MVIKLSGKKIVYTQCIIRQPNDLCLENIYYTMTESYQSFVIHEEVENRCDYCR